MLGQRGRQAAHEIGDLGGMKGPLRAAPHQAGQSDILPDTDNKEPWAALRQEACVVDLHRADAVAQFGQRAQHLFKVGPRVPGEQTHHILKGNDPGGRTARYCRPDHPHPFHEHTAARTREALPLACEREILTGARRPIEVNVARHRLRLKTCNIRLNQSALAPILAVNRAFHRVDVIGKGTVPAAPQPCAHHATAAEKLGKPWGFFQLRHHIYV